MTKPATIPRPDVATVAEAQLAWRRRVARIGSLLQVGFAALWLFRGTLATGISGRLLLAASLAGGAVAVGVWVEATTRGLAPRPTGPVARHLERFVTGATIAQLVASTVLPFVLSALGRPDLTVGTISITIGILLLWLHTKLRTVGHLVAGVLLVAVPVVLACALSGNALIAASGLSTGVILIANAIVGARALHRGIIGPNAHTIPSTDASRL